MKIIITENQNYVLRRLQQFIEIVEDQIEGYELNEDGSVMYDPNLPAVSKAIEYYLYSFFNNNLFDKKVTLNPSPGSGAVILNSKFKLKA